MRKIKALLFERFFPAMAKETIAGLQREIEKRDAEIERLKQTDEVKLAQKYQRLLNRKRKYMADLRWLEKRGKQLMDEGWTIDTIELLFKDIPEED
jgi:vacuolar-type H+-ATPase subunit I/STV1